MWRRKRGEKVQREGERGRNGRREMRKEREEQQETVAVMAAIRYGHIVGVTIWIILCSSKLTHTTNANFIRTSSAQLMEELFFKWSL